MCGEILEQSLACSKLSMQVLLLVVFFLNGIDPLKWNFKQGLQVLRNKIARDFAWG